MRSGESELGYVRDAFDLMDEIDRLDDETAIRDRLSVLLSACGFEHFVVARLPQPRENIGPAMLLKRWPQVWQSRYDRYGYYQYDPASRHCFETIEPFLWSDLRTDPRSDPMGHRVMQEAADHGLKEGLCIPINDAKGFQAVVSMAGEAIDLPPKAKRAIHLLSIYAYGAADRLSQGRKPSVTRLSARERDVLSYMANGMTAAQVGNALTISETTVMTHLRKAKEKLGTRTLTHTVVEAMRQSQIRL
ncbi:MAG TPA: LuxR family transcriptional regulator [Microvirga sp.]|jgi:LuxR family quorum sensing-dependent transcriptional regulator|nr:LuxR family transcriptional regulator [Microvirga sp.]